MNQEKYWGQLALKSRKQAVTSPDINVDVLEKESIEKYLNQGDVILDLGSGDGLATLEFAKKVRRVEAIEVSPALVKLAKKNQSRTKIRNINWTILSVLEIEKHFKNLKFDCIVAKRCLINLETWAEQKNALNQIAHLLKKGGYLLITDGFNDGLKNLNRLRTAFALKAIPPAKFNLYYDRDKFEVFVKDNFEIIEQNNFGIYYFLSHFVYPLVIKPKEPKHKSKINQIATEIALKVGQRPISPWPKKLLEEYGYCNFYALRKR